MKKPATIHKHYHLQCYLITTRTTLPEVCCGNKPIIWIPLQFLQRNSIWNMQLKFMRRL